jgi:hypothetical protein
LTIINNLPPGYGPICKVRVVDLSDSDIFSLSEVFDIVGAPTLEPTVSSVDPTIIPTITPTTSATSTLPTSSPTAHDTVAIHVTIRLNAANTSEVTEGVVLHALTGHLAGASISDIHRFMVVTANTTTTGRRQLVSSAIVAVDTSFEVRNS